MKLGNIVIGREQPPFIIAEMSGNHNQSLERALEIVEAAAKTGAHALKLQTYTAETMTLDIKTNEFFISDENSLWKGNSLHDLYKKAYTPWEWHQTIMDRANELGMICFSSPFDESAVDFLEELKSIISNLVNEPNLKTVFLKPLYGDASGVRGAALLGKNNFI